MIYKMVRVSDGERVGMVRTRDSAVDGMAVMVRFLSELYGGCGYGRVNSDNLWYVEFIRGGKLIREEYTIAPASLKDQLRWRWDSIRIRPIRIRLGIY